MADTLRLARGSFVAFCTVVFLAASDGAEGLPKLAGVEITDLAGHRYAFGERAGAKLSVLFFLGTECPISNGYAPALKRLHDSFASSGVVMLGVHCDPDVTADEARAHAREYELPFELVLDHEQRLARACGVDTMPTAVVIGADGRAVYRGRIDNRYVAAGVRRPEATVFDLKSAVEAVLAGRQPERATTEAVGCPLPPPRE